MRSLDILTNLIAFPTVSRTPNVELAAYIRDILEPLGAEVRTASADEGRTNLWISFGPSERPGVVLSGHSDVVPVAGQAWSRDPFALTEEDGRLYGRGTADMKGFLACAVACAERAASRRLQTPLHLAISYDEEIGCVGVRSLLDQLQMLPTLPLLCLVGEPTSMRVALGHKGKVALKATCIGREAHSALAPSGLNAIHLACEFVAGLRKLQADLAARPGRDDDYDIPYSTLHAGVIRGGEALNIVPARCEVDFEIRNIELDAPEVIERAIRDLAEEVSRAYRTTFPEADIRIELVNAYPGLNTRHPGAIRFVNELTGANGAPLKLAFGTEGGLFSEKLGIPAIVCGPGSMDQGHKPDEFVTRDQLEQCDRMLANLLDRLERGAVRLEPN